jgi:hypothetical protein
MEAENQTRESGYYWVKLGGGYFSDRWEVAEYRNWAENPWYITDHGEGLSENAIAQVGYPIPRPGQEDQVPQDEDSIRLGPQPFKSHYWFDKDGVPNGGILNGTGFTISIQRGVVETTESGELAPNGVFSQTLVAIVIDVLSNFYQQSKFANAYNEEAIYHFKCAQNALRRRLRDRAERNVLNTHES